MGTFQKRSELYKNNTPQNKKCQKCNSIFHNTDRCIQKPNQIKNNSKLQKNKNNKKNWEEKRDVWKNFDYQLYQENNQEQVELNTDNKIDQIDDENVIILEKQEKEKDTRERNLNTMRSTNILPEYLKDFQNKQIDNQEKKISEEKLEFLKQEDYLWQNTNKDIDSVAIPTLAEKYYKQQIEQHKNKKIKKMNLIKEKYLNKNKKISKIQLTLNQQKLSKKNQNKQLLNQIWVMINYKCLQAVYSIRCLKSIPSINQFNIKKLLKKENLKIEELLDEESISDEINNEKSAIHKFLTSENLQKVLNYLMKDQNTEDQKKAYKYPKVAEQFLSCKATAILQFFQAEDSSKKLENFDQLFSFVINTKQQSILQEEINFTRASYVKTVVVSLLQNQPQTFATYLFSQELILDALIAHAYSKSVHFLLKSLLQVPHKEDENPNEIDQNVERESVTVWITEIEKSKINLLEKILQTLITCPDNSQILFRSNNLTQVFLEYVRASYGGHEKVASLKNDYLQSIQEHFFNNFREKKARNLSKIFIELTNSQKQSEDDKKNLLNFFKNLLDHQKQYFNAKQKKLSTFGKDHLVVPPNLIYTVSVTYNIFSKNKNDQQFADSFEEEYVSFLFSLFQQFPLNNVLHQKVDMLLILVAETENRDLFQKFFNNKTFLQLKEDLSNNTNQKQNTFQGFIIKLIASLEQSQFAEILYDDKNHQNFMQNFYFPKIEQQNKSLGGVEYDNSAPHAEFYFSVEEIEEKYSSFLNGDNLVNGQESKKEQKKNKEEEQQQEEDAEEKKISQQVQKNLMKEIKLDVLETKIRY